MKVYIMSGPSGSGKSTYISKHKSPIAQVVSADDFFIVNGKYVFNAAKLEEAHALCMRNYLDLVGWRDECEPSKIPCDEVWVDNTNISSEEIAPYYQVAKALGHDVEIIKLTTPIEVANPRNVHGVTEDVSRRQYANQAKAIWPKRWKVKTVNG